MLHCSFQSTKRLSLLTVSWPFFVPLSMNIICSSCLLPRPRCHSSLLHHPNALSHRLIIHHLQKMSSCRNFFAPGALTPSALYLFRPPLYLRERGIFFFASILLHAAGPGAVSLLFAHTRARPLAHPTTNERSNAAGYLISQAGSVHATSPSSQHPRIDCTRAIPSRRVPLLSVFDFFFSVATPTVRLQLGREWDRIAPNDDRRSSSWPSCHRLSSPSSSQYHNHIPRRLLSTPGCLPPSHHRPQLHLQPQSN